MSAAKLSISNSPLPGFIVYVVVSSFGRALRALCPVIVATPVLWNLDLMENQLEMLSFNNKRGRLYEDMIVLVSKSKLHM